MVNLEIFKNYFITNRELHYIIESPETRSHYIRPRGNPCR
jgi:hypothetical protein